MSSHHIVRDQQEPALLIAHTDSNSKDIVGQLLEWSPTVIVLQNTLETALTWQTKVDWVICKADFLKEAYLLTQHQFPVKILPTEKSFVHVAIQQLIRKGYGAVNICMELQQGVKIDEFEQYSALIDMVFYGNGYKGYFLQKEGLSKWVPADTFFIIPHDEHITRTQGLTPEGNKKFVAKNSEIIKIQTDKPVFVMEK